MSCCEYDDRELKRRIRRLESKLAGGLPSGDTIVIEPELITEYKTAQLPWAGIRTDGTVFNATVTEDSEGQWTMVFDTPHPSGSGGYLYMGTGEEDSQRDNPKITLVDGSDTATQLQIMVTVDDNGTAADPFEDNDYSFIVYAECEFVSDVQLNNAQSSASTKLVDTSYLFHASVDPVDIHDAAPTLAITQNRADAGWSSAANGADYTGTPDQVQVFVNVQVDENAASNYWALPEIIVERNGIRIGSASAVLMQNNGTYSNESTLPAAIVDQNPGANPQYRFLLEDADNRTNEAIPQEHSHVALRAIEKCEVLVPSETSDE